MNVVPFRPVGDFAEAFALRLFEAIPKGITLKEARELRLLALANIDESQAEIMDVEALTSFYGEQFKGLTRLAACHEAADLMSGFARTELPKLASDRRPRFLAATLAANRIQAFLISHPDHVLARLVDVENVSVSPDGRGGFTVEVPLMPGAHERFARAAFDAALACEEMLEAAQRAQVRLKTIETHELGMWAA